MKEGMAFLAFVVMILLVGSLIGGSCAEQATRQRMAEDYCDRLETRTEYKDCVDNVYTKGFK